MTQNHNETAVFWSNSSRVSPIKTGHLSLLSSMRNFILAGQSCKENSSCIVQVFHLWYAQFECFRFSIGYA